MRPPSMVFLHVELYRHVAIYLGNKCKNDMTQKHKNPKPKLRYTLAILKTTPSVELSSDLSYQIILNGEDHM